MLLETCTSTHNLNLNVTQHLTCWFKPIVWLCYFQIRKKREYDIEFSESQKLLNTDPDTSQLDQSIHY